jgi:hypothetical protein
MKKIIGWLVLAILAVGIFALIAATNGIWEAFGIIGVSIVFTALVAWAVWAINE